MNHCLEIPDSVHFKLVANLNIQPGDLAIRTALQISQELKREGIRLGKSAKRARTLLGQEAERRNWIETHCMGVDSKLNQRIRAHFAAANNRFANRTLGMPLGSDFQPGDCSTEPHPQRVRTWLRLLGNAIGTTKEHC